MKRTLATLCIAAAFALAATVAQAQTACQDTVAQIISPAPGATLPLGAVTFTWCNASGDYFLDIESVPGAHDIFFAFVVGVETVTLGPDCAPVPPTGCIPPNGETIYVTLWTNTAQHGPKNYVAAPTVTYTAGSSVGVPPTPARAFTLSAPIPNPVRTTLAYRVTLPGESHVRVEIFNLAGRSVRTLEDCTLPAGQYNVSWDTRNQDGPVLSSGVYFLGLTTQGARTVRRFVLLR